MAGPRDTVAVQTQSPGLVQPGAGWQLFWAPSVSRKVGSPSAGLGDQGTRAACSSQPYGLGSLPAAPGTPPGTGPLPLRALRALRAPGLALSVSRCRSRVSNLCHLVWSLRPVCAVGLQLGVGEVKELVPSELG